MIRDAISRLWFPPLTYYHEDGTLDFARMEAMLRRVHPFCQGVLVPGSTGDGWILPQADQEAIIRRFLEGFSFGRFQMLLGALLPDTEKTLASIARSLEILEERSGRRGAEAMEALGVKAFVVCLPHGMTDDGAQEAALSRVLALGLPTAFYQLPQVTGAFAAPGRIAALAERFPNLIMCKDSGGGDELAASGLLSDRAMLFRGAEGDPTAMLFGEKPIYDGLLLSTVNCFAEHYAALLAGRGDYGAIGPVIARVFEAAGKAPVSNAFSDANRAMDHVLFWGKKTPEAPQPLCVGGAPLPRALTELAFSEMDRAGLVPARGYGE